MRWRGVFFGPFTAVTRVREPPSDLNIIGGSSSRPGIYEALIPNEGANPHILQRHCNNAMRRSSHAGLGAASRASFRASNINILCPLMYMYLHSNLKSYLSALRNVTTDHSESAQGSRMLPSFSKLCVLVSCCWKKASLRQSILNIFKLSNKSSKSPAAWLSSVAPLKLISTLPPEVPASHSDAKAWAIKPFG